MSFILIPSISQCLVSTYYMTGAARHWGAVAGEADKEQSQLTVYSLTHTETDKIADFEW